MGEKKYIVTHVSLSVEDDEENGFTCVKLCDTKEDAVKVMQQWKQEEIETIRDRGGLYALLVNADDEVHIAKDCGNNQIRIKIHEV